MNKKTHRFISKDLGESLKNGDFAAYAVLFEKYYPKLCNYIFKLGHNQSLAEDIAQETFAIVWENKGKIDANRSIQGYLFKICHNEFLKHKRTRKKERAFLDQVKAEVFYEINVAEALNEDRLERLRNSIEELPPRCKEAFVLSKFEKLKYVEIADQMGVSKKTVEAHISKAFSLLREQLISMVCLVIMLN